MDGQPGVVGQGKHQDVDVGPGPCARVLVSVVVAFAYAPILGGSDEPIVEMVAVEPPSAPFEVEDVAPREQIVVVGLQLSRRVAAVVHLLSAFAFALSTPLIQYSCLCSCVTNL